MIINHKMLVRSTKHLKNVINNQSFYSHCRSICSLNNLNNNPVNNEEYKLRRNGLFKNTNLSRSYATVPHLDFDSSPPIVKYEGIMKLLVDNPAIEFCQQSLVSLHASTGLPWWATIVLVTCTARTLVTLPCSLYQQYIFAKITHLKYEMNEIVKELKRETNIAVTIFGWSEAYGRNLYNRSLKKQWDKLIIRENCHPMKGMLLVIFQVPLWVVLSASFRNICFMLPYPTQAAHQTFTELSVEGFGWISDLTAVDSLYILPILVGVFNLINVEMLQMLRIKEPSKAQKFSMWAGRTLSVAIVPIACMVPSGMSLYWTTSSVFSIFQNLLVASPRFRKFSRIPETEDDLDHPYRYLYNKLKKRIGLKS